MQVSTFKNSKLPLLATVLAIFDDFLAILRFFDDLSQDGLEFSDSRTLLSLDFRKYFPIDTSVHMGGI